MQAILIIVLILVNTPLYVFLFKVIFPNKGDFAESVGYSFMPDIFSLFRGKLFEDWAASFKLSAFLFCCIGAVVGEYALIMKLFG